MMAPTEGKKRGNFHEVSIRQVFYKCEWPGMVLAYRNAWYQRKKEKSSIPHDFKICAQAAEEHGFGNWEKYLHIIEDMNIIQVEKNTGYTNC